MISAELCSAFLSTDISINKLDNPQLRQLLEREFGFVLPRQFIFHKKHLPNCFSEVMKKIKKGLANHSIWISADCSCDTLCREVANKFMGCLDSRQYHLPYLVNMDFLEKADSASIAW